VKYTKFSE